MLLITEITLFPYTEIMSQTSFSSEQIKNCIRSYFVLRYSCSTLYLKFFNLFFNKTIQCFFLIKISLSNAQSAKNWLSSSKWLPHKNLVMVGLYLVPSVPISIQRRRKTRIISSPSIMPRKIINLVLCVLCF